MVFGLTTSALVFTIREERPANAVVCMKTLPSRSPKARLTIESGDAGASPSTRVSRRCPPHSPTKSRLARGITSTLCPGVPGTGDTWGSVSCCFPGIGGSSSVLERWRPICCAEALAATTRARTSASRRPWGTNRRTANRAVLVSANHSCMILMTDVIEIARTGPSKAAPRQRRPGWARAVNF